MQLSPRLTMAGRFLRAHTLWIALFALLGVVVAVRAPTPPATSVEGVAAFLGDAVSGVVAPEDFVWEPRGSVLGDAVLGRRVLFLARSRNGSSGLEAPRDLYRARVRLTRAGRPLVVRDVRNLTSSPLGDEGALIARGRYAAFTTSAGGLVRGVTLLQLDGDGSRGGLGALARASSWLDGWRSTASGVGIGRVEVTFGDPPPGVVTELADEQLVMALGKEAIPAALGLRTAAFDAGSHNVFKGHAQRVAAMPRPLSEVTVEAVAGSLGTAPARWIGARLEGVRSFGRAFRSHRPAASPFSEFDVRPPVASVQDWPPTPLAPPVQPPFPGEGMWRAVPSAVPLSNATATDEAHRPPPALFETAVRPSVAHPEVLVRLVAIDTRQLDLRLEAGTEGPRSPFGLRNAGRLPAELVDQLVGAFAARTIARSSVRAASSEGELGFVENGTALVPPRKGAPSVALDRDGRVRMGAWTDKPSPEVVSMMQTPGPLVGASSARTARAGTSSAAERSALCALPSGQLVYAWTRETDPEALDNALVLTGCAYAVPLARDAGSLGLAFYRPSEGGGREPTSIGGEPSLTSWIDGASPDPMLYLLRREPKPSAELPVAARASEATPHGGWAPDGGRQPEPEWLPAVHGAMVTSLGAQVHLTAFAPGRVAWQLRVGSKEPQTHASSALPSGLTEPELTKAVAAVGVGIARKRGAAGLAVAGATGFPFRADASGVLVIEKGRARIEPSPSFVLPAGADATELLLTADDGKLRPEAREVGSMRAHAAACVLPDGTFLVASTTFDTDEATTAALIDLGCSRVAALDRGAHVPAFVQRAGTETPPVNHAEVSVLYALEAGAKGRAGLFE